MRSNNSQNFGFGGQSSQKSEDSIFEINLKHPINASMKLLFWGFLGVPFAVGLIWGYVPENSGFVSGLAQTLGLAGNRAAVETINTTRPMMKEAQESVNGAFDDTSFSPETIDALNEDQD